MVTARESGALVDWWPEIPAEVSGQLLIPLPEGFEVTDDWWEGLRESHPGRRIELTRQRRLRIVMTAPIGGRITIKLGRQIDEWVDIAGGEVFDSSVDYHMWTEDWKYPDGSWLSPERVSDDPMWWAKTFTLSPDLIWEVRSPSQSVEDQREKMVEWIEAGVRLGWLIDPFERKVWVYRANGEVEALDDPATLSGEDVCVGLSVDMSRVW